MMVSCGESKKNWRADQWRGLRRPECRDPYRAIDGYGWQVFGIRQGTHGLTKRPVDAEELSLQLFTGNILRMGGTILGTVNSGDPFAFPTPDGMLKDRSDEIIEGYHSSD